MPVPAVHERLRLRASHPDQQCCRLFGVLAPL